MWNQDDAEKHSPKANTPAKARRWAAIVNSAIQNGKTDREAIQIANAAIKRRAQRKRNSRKRR